MKTQGVELMPGKNLSGGKRPKGVCSLFIHWTVVLSYEMKYSEKFNIALQQKLDWVAWFEAM